MGASIDWLPQATAGPTDNVLSIPRPKAVGVYILISVSHLLTCVVRVVFNAATSAP